MSDVSRGPSGADGLSMEENKGFINTCLNFMEWQSIQKDQNYTKYISGFLNTCLNFKEWQFIQKDYNYTKYISEILETKSWDTEILENEIRHFFLLNNPISGIWTITEKYSNDCYIRNQNNKRDIRINERFIKTQRINFQ